MNLSSWTQSTSLEARLFVIMIAIAGLALLAAGSGSPGEARAASGGIGGSSGGGDGGSSSDSSPGRYDRLWERVSASDRDWARRTAKCESGLDPKAIGGGGTYRGAFQFTRPTWKRSPKSPGGDPIRYRYRVQAVVAVLLKNRDGANPWPSCG